MPSVAAAESSYVYCDNGLRCFKAPCPSNSALDLANGKIIKGVSIDTSELPRADRERPYLSDMLHYGSVVVRGRIESRPEALTSDEYVQKVIVAGAIERETMMKERQHCSSRGLY
ncbi:hypothetical protein [Mesorhizobium sp. B2-7-1]|uniref:hypothetical protein n=1 Tax=Mesorhizobium sp. B2-7-1 TaxID=2589909 RepID=UPI001FEDE601|nr:hypothetical protein [Mesorhizobium sp. B2-7-1]